MNEQWLTGPPNDDMNSEHLYNRVFYGIEDARHMILNGWSTDIVKKYQRPRKSRPYQVGQSWGISWIEEYLVIKKLDWQFSSIIRRRGWTRKLFEQLNYYFTGD